MVKKFEHSARKIRRATLPAATVALAIAGCGGVKKHNTNTNKAPVPPNSTNTISALSKVKVSNRNPIPKDRLGYDVSYPNSNNLPTPGAFAIVGLNGINAVTTNKYYKSQLAWANSSRGNGTQPKAAVYVHTDNPLQYKPRVADYPAKGKNVDGTCNGTNSLACEYQYGENTASNDLAREGSKIARLVWLDVEGTEDGYTWEKSTTNNATVLEGMTAEFEKAGDKVGIYSGEGDWRRTIGTTPKHSNLEGLPDWILGATDTIEAVSECQTSRGFTGKIVLAQVAGQMLDRDISCS